MKERLTGVKQKKKESKPCTVPVATLATLIQNVNIQIQELRKEQKTHFPFYYS